ncbi:MAG: prepilin-type N-terminal cleavage/methylation domain-containing protein [Deltaproteobacteria bacterium]|nr:prepilin-type N-terminal cleavage/methylation domain-containing protein [Deltaproteobacteria bacterium]
MTRRRKSALARLRNRVAVAGYTMVEVMMAVAVLAVGLLGVAAMQTGTVGGNIQAQETTMATSLARLWIERLRRDGASWVVPGVPGAGAIPGQINGTRYLQLVAAAPAWAVPPNGAALTGAGTDPYTRHTVETAAFDHFGRDVLTTHADRRYCTQVRVAWVYPGTAVRADVRVFWHKRLRAENAGDVSPARVACNTAAANAALNVASSNAAGRGQMMRHLSAVYLSTVIRYTPLRF